MAAHNIMCKCAECKAWSAQNHANGLCNECHVPIDSHPRAEACNGKLWRGRGAVA